MKRFSKALPLVLCCSVAAIIAASLILTPGGETASSVSDVTSTISRYSFASGAGADVDIPSEEDALKLALRRQLLENEFIKRGIVLTAQEENDAKNHLAQQLKILDEMKAKGGSEQENAEEVLALMNQYLQHNNISMEEYAALLQQEISFQLKYDKLLAQAYNGNAALLEEELEQNLSASLPSQSASS